MKMSIVGLLYSVVVCAVSAVMYNEMQVIAVV